jgi:hypothetical protein
MKELPQVPDPLRFSKGARFDSMERKKHQNPNPLKPKGSATRKG